MPVVFVAPRLRVIPLGSQLRSTPPPPPTPPPPCDRQHLQPAPAHSLRAQAFFRPRPCPMLPDRSSGQRTRSLHPPPFSPPSFHHLFNPHNPFLRSSRPSRSPARNSLLSTRLYSSSTSSSSSSSSTASPTPARKKTPLPHYHSDKVPKSYRAVLVGQSHPPPHIRLPKHAQNGQKNATVIVICASAPFLPRVESQPPPYDQIEPTLSSLGLHDGIVSDFMRDAVGSDVSPALAEFWELVRSFEDERTKLATGDGPTAAVKLEGSKLRFVEDAIWKKYLTFTLIDPSLSSIPHEVFSWILHVCANGRASASVDRVDSLVSDMDRSGIPLSATDNANLLTVWMRAQWVARRPEQCIEAAVERGLGMCMQLHREFLRHYFTDGTKRLVDELVLSLATRPTTTTTTETTPRAAAVPPSPATEVAEFCFRALGDIFDCDGVVGLHAELRPILWERGYSFTIGTYECILATLSHASHLKTPSFGFFPPMNGKTVSSSLHIAESIFREALSFYPADRRLYNLMLRAALRHTKTDLHSATRLLDEIVQLKITLPSASIAALAATYTRMGFTNELKLIWKGTLPALADLPPSVSSAAPIKLAQHVGAGTSATEEWRKGKRHKLYSHHLKDLYEHKMWQATVFGLVRQRRWWSTMEMFKMMRKSGFRPSARLYARALEEIASRNRPRSAVFLYRMYRTDGYRASRRVSLALERLAESTGVALYETSPTKTNRSGTRHGTRRQSNIPSAFSVLPPL